MNWECLTGENCVHIGHP